MHKCYMTKLSTTSLIQHHLTISLIIFILSSLATSSIHGESKDAQHTRAKAESYVLAGKLEEALTIYKTSIDLFEKVGLIHLRIAQLYQQLAQSVTNEKEKHSLNVQAAYYYQQCMLDQTLSNLYRNNICKSALESLTSPLLIAGNSDSVRIIKPEYFAGPVQSGMRLPNGPVQLEVTDTYSKDVHTIHLPLQQPLKINSENFIPPKPKRALDLIGPEPIIPARPTTGSLVSNPVDLSQLSTTEIFAYSLISVGALLTISGVSMYIYCEVKGSCFEKTPLGNQFPMIFIGSGPSLSLIGGGLLSITF